MSIFTYNSVVQEFLEGKSAATKQAYLSDLLDFCAYLGVAKVDQALADWFYSLPSQATLKAMHYKHILRIKGLKNSTINRRISMLKSLSEAAKAKGMIPWSLEVERELATPELTSLPEDLRNVINRLMEVLEKQQPLLKASRDQAILLLIFDLGLKTSQLESLRIADLNLVEGSILIEGKGTKRKRKLTKRCQLSLLQWVEIRGLKAGPLFQNFDRADKAKGLTGTSIYRIIRELGDAIGIKLTPQSLRRAVLEKEIAQAKGSQVRLAKLAHNSGYGTVKSLNHYLPHDKNENPILESSH